MKAKLRWGVLGTGRMADWFCSDFGSVGNGQLTAVCSRHQANADIFAARYGVSKTYTAYGDMLASDDVDIVYIATPHTTHKKQVLDALAAGKHVLCEKPLVTRVADAEDVITAARAAKVYLMEAMWTWHLPAMRAAKNWVDSGRIGRLVHLKTDFGYPVPYASDQREYDPQDAGGALREMGIYPVAIGRYFIGREPESVHVVYQNAPNGVEADLSALFDYGDMTATLATSFRCRMRNAAYVVGEEGYIVLPDAFRCHEAYLFHLDEQIDHFKAPRSERGYHYQAIAVGEDIAEGRLESEVLPLSASLSFQRDMATILGKTGRGEG